MWWLARGSPALPPGHRLLAPELRLRSLPPGPDGDRHPSPRRASPRGQHGRANQRQHRGL